MKKIVWIHNVFKEEHLYKDCFAFIKYLAESYELEPSILYHVNNQEQILSSSYRNIKLIPLKYKGKMQNFSLKGEWYLIWYLIKNAFKIDVLMRVHLSYSTAILSLIYKLLNKKGVIVLKADGYGVLAALKREHPSIFQRCSNRFIKKIFLDLFKRADQICAETPDLYNFISKTYPQYKEKIKLVLNGFDEQQHAEYNQKETLNYEKENLIIVSGRIGSKQKNTELIFEAIEKVNFKNWKIIFLGPIEKDECDFNSYINTFLREHPQLKNHLIFTGAIWDRKQYWDWFKRAKVFLHTAVYESYGIVFTEAFRFSNYIISTDVGIAGEIIKRGAGEIISQNDPEKLSELLQHIIDGNKNIDEIMRTKQYDMTSLSWENEIKKVDLIL